MLAAAACYDPREAIPLWERMAQLVVVSARRNSHRRIPDPANRIQTLQSLMADGAGVLFEVLPGQPPLK
jgi:hypothetical protein